MKEQIGKLQKENAALKVRCFDAGEVNAQQNSTLQGVCGAVIDKFGLEGVKTLEDFYEKLGEVVYAPEVVVEKVVGDK